MPLLYQKFVRLAHPEAHSDAVTVVAFSPDGEWLASGGLDGRVCIWQTGTGKLLYVFSGTSAVLSVLWLDANELVCGMENGTMATLAIQAKLINLYGFLAHRYPVERLAFNGTHLASGAHKEVKIWARQPSGSWTFVADIRAPRRSAYTTKCDIITTSLHWTSGPSHPMVLLVTYLSHGVAAFDGRTWARIGGTAFPGRIADASLTKDGHILAVSNMLTGFELFELKGFLELEPLFAFQQDVSSGPPIPLQFLHGDHAIVGGTLHGQVNVWDIYSRRKQPLALDGDMHVLAIGAHYDPQSNDFFIATGIFNLGSSSSIVIWKTQEALTRRSRVGKLGSRPVSANHSAFNGSLVVMVLVGAVLCATLYFSFPTQFRFNGHEIL